MTRYIWIFLLIATAFISLIATLNFIFDPFWVYGRSLPSTSEKAFFDERVQKTNLLVNSMHNYDGIVLGSSRSSFIDPRNFTDGKYFNYASANMFADEYAGYIKIAFESMNIRKVALGLDFYATNKNRFAYYAKKPEYYLENAKFSKYTQLISLNGILYTYDTLQCSQSHQCDEYYDSAFIKHMRPQSISGRDDDICRQLQMYDEFMYGKGYAWDYNYSQYLRNAHQINSSINFNVYTTPTSYLLFGLLVQDGRLPQYEKWLRLIINEYGFVWDFMGINSVTKNLDNYTDAHHFIPAVGKMMADRMEGKNKLVPADFGVKVTKANLENHLAEIRRQAALANMIPLVTAKANLKKDKCSLH